MDLVHVLSLPMGSQLLKSCYLPTMAAEMLYLANIGVDLFRMDAVAFTWKQMNTDCENLPEDHKLLCAFNALCRIAAPSVLFKFEANLRPLTSSHQQWSQKWSLTCIKDHCSAQILNDKAPYSVIPSSSTRTCQA